MTRGTHDRRHLGQYRMPPHRVLVVDDESGVRALLEDQLSRLGLEVYLAAHGEEAVVLYGQVAPHLLLVGFLEPRLDDFGFLDAVRATPRGASLPIIAMSGEARNPETVAEARARYRVRTFLSKPLDGESVRDSVKQALAGVRSDSKPPLGEQWRASAATPSTDSTAPNGLSVVGRGRAALADVANSAACDVSNGPAVESGLAEELIVDGRYRARPVPELELEGAIGTTPVAQILSALRFDRMTGMLDLTAGPVHRRVYVVEGRPTFMQSNAERENVGALLLRRGRMTEQDFQRCRRYMLEKRRTLQQSLLELRLVSEAELATAYKLLARELLPVVLGMSSGLFQWRDTDAFLGRVPEGRFDPLEILFEGIARNVHPPQIFAFFSGREDVPLFRTLQWKELEPAFTRVFSETGGLILKIDGMNTFRTLTLGQDIDSASCMTPLFALVTSGMVVLPRANELGMEAAVRVAAAEVRREDSESSVARERSIEPEDEQAQHRVEEFHEDIMSRDFYEIFGVQRSAAIEEIKSAYFELAKQWHADVFAGRQLGGTKAKLDEIFARMSEAYETITDADKRADYVLFLERKDRGLPTDVREILRGEQLYDQALAMLRRKDYLGAREVLEEAARLNPDPLYFATLGWVIYCASPRSERAVLAAVGHLKRALKEQENLPMAYQYLGTIAFRRNNYGEANKWWSRCLEWEADNVEASRGLRVISQRLRQRTSRSGILGRIRGKKS